MFDTDKNRINYLEYFGCNYFRQRLILAVLSGKQILIKNIRPSQGIYEFEVSNQHLFKRKLS